MKTFKEVTKYNFKRSVHFFCKILNSKLYLCKLNFTAKNAIYFETKSLLDKKYGELNFLAKKYGFFDGYINVVTRYAILNKRFKTDC